MPPKVEIGKPFYPPNNPNEKVTEIRAGRKRLTLSILPWGYASARLDNIEEQQRQKGETTAVFTAAKKILEKQAKLQGEIRFEIETSWSSMRGWIETTGVELFHFKIQQKIDDPEGIYAQTVIKPK